MNVRRVPTGRAGFMPPDRLDRPMRAAPWLILLLLVPLAGGQASEVRVSASPGAGAIELTLGADAPREMRIVLVREDPILGPVVDRIAPVNVSGSEWLNVSLGGIRGGADLTIKVLDAEVELPLVANVTNLVDAAKLLDLPDLANVSGIDVPAPSEHGHVLAPYAVTDANAGCTCRLATSPKGSVVASWLATTSDAASTSAATLVTIAVSTDGGHTFGSPRVLNSNASTWVSNFAWAERDGDIFFLFEEAMPTSPSSAEWSNTRLVRLDGATGVTLSTASLPRSIQAVNLWGSAVRPDGAMLIAHPGTRDDGRSALVVDEIRRDGSAGRLGAIALPPEGGFAGYAHVLADRAGGVAVAYTEFANGRVHVHRSSDGGKTFALEHDLRALNALGDKRTIHGARIDDAGTVHLLSLLEHPEVQAEGGGTFSNTSLAYARVPLAGPVSVVPLSGGQLAGALVPEGDAAETPLLIVHGLRVWIVWNAYGITADRTGSMPLATYAIESTTGGAAFGKPYRIRGADHEVLALLHDVALLPDGRPILFGWYKFPAIDRPRLSVFPFFDPLAPVDGVAASIPATRFDPPPAGTRSPPTADPGPTPPSIPSVVGVPGGPVRSEPDATEARDDTASQGAPPPTPAPTPLPAIAAFVSLAAAAFATRRRP